MSFSFTPVAVLNRRSSSFVRPGVSNLRTTSTTTIAAATTTTTTTALTTARTTTTATTTTTTTTDENDDANNKNNDNNDYREDDNYSYDDKKTTTTTTTTTRMCRSLSGGIGGVCLLAGRIQAALDVLRAGSNRSPRGDNVGCHDDLGTSVCPARVTAWALRLMLGAHSHSRWLKQHVSQFGIKHCNNKQIFPRSVLVCLRRAAHIIFVVLYVVFCRHHSVVASSAAIQCLSPNQFLQCT